MRPFRLPILLSISGLIAAPVAHAGPGPGSGGPDAEIPMITLYGEPGRQGGAIMLDRDIDNLQDVPVADSDSGSANDYAMSAHSVGRWQVCMDAGHVTDCLVVDGDHDDFGEHGRSISSVRYLGPSTRSPQSGRGSRHSGGAKVRRALRTLLEE